MFAQIKAYWWLIKIVGVAVLLAALSTVYLLWRGAVESRDLAKDNLKIVALQRDQAVNSANDTVQRYRQLSENIDKNLAAMNVTLGDHAKAIAAIDRKSNNTLAGLRALRETSDDATRAVLDTHMPDHACLLDERFCKTDSAGGVQPDQAVPAK